MARRRSRYRKKPKTRGRRNRTRRKRYTRQRRRVRGGAKMDKKKHSRASERPEYQRARRQQEEQRQRAHMKTTVEQLPKWRRNLRKDAYAKDTGQSPELILRDSLFHNDDRQPDPHGIATVLIDAAGFGDEDVPINRRAWICDSARTYADSLSGDELSALKHYLGLRLDQPLEDSVAWKKCNDPAYAAEDIEGWLGNIGQEGWRGDASAGDFVDNVREKVSYDTDDDWD